MKKIIIFNCLILIANVLAIPVSDNEDIKSSERTSTEFWIKVSLTVFLVLIGGLFAGIY